MCPGCGSRSGRVHSRYERRVSDAAIGGQEMLICLQVRRFFCGNEECSKKTFAEQVSGVTVPHARRTPLLRGILERIALAWAVVPVPG
ncbi:transposase family protein [Amycolatopsis lurida]